VEYYGGVRVIYSGVAEKADDVIKRILKTEKLFWIVITSDREIEKQAWKENCVPVSSSLFSEILNGEEYYFEHAKGVTLYKKGKAITESSIQTVMIMKFFKIQPAFN